MRASRKIVLAIFETLSNYGVIRKGAAMQNGGTLAIAAQTG